MSNIKSQMQETVFVMCLEWLENPWGGWLVYALLMRLGTLISVLVSFAFQSKTELAALECPPFWGRSTRFLCFQNDTNMLLYKFSFLQS